MQIDSTMEVVRWAFAYLALGGLAACVAALLIVSPQAKMCWGEIGRAWNRFRRLGVFGQIVVAVGLAVCWQRGAAKWTPVAHGGGDDILTVMGIYTDCTNVVDETVSPPVTNKVPVVRVEWLGNGGSADTPVSVRAAETNEWTEVAKIDPAITQDGITNILTFATSTNYAGVAYWWFGVDKPAIVVTEEGIEIRAFRVTTKSVYIAWVCGEQEATSYFIRRREQGKADWEIVEEVPARFGIVNEWTGRMFTVDKTYDWSIVTVIEEGEE